jgi:hypothetical protein
MTGIGTPSPSKISERMCSSGVVWFFFRKLPFAAGFKRDVQLCVPASRTSKKPAGVTGGLS